MLWMWPLFPGWDRKMDKGKLDFMVTLWGNHWMLVPIQNGFSWQCKPGDTHHYSCFAPGSKTSHFSHLKSSGEVCAWVLLFHADSLKGQLLHHIEEPSFAILTTAKSVASHCSRGSKMMGKMCVWWKIGLWLQEKVFCSVCGSCSGNVQHTVLVCTMGLCPVFSPKSTPSLPPSSSPTSAHGAHCCLTGARRSLKTATCCNWPTCMPTEKPAVPLEVPGASSLTGKLRSMLPPEPRLWLLGNMTRAPWMRTKKLSPQKHVRKYVANHPLKIRGKQCSVKLTRLRCTCNPFSTCIIMNCSTCFLQFLSVVCPFNSKSLIFSVIYFKFSTTVPVNVSMAPYVISLHS